MEISEALQTLESPSSGVDSISQALECLAPASRVPATRQLLDTEETLDRLLQVLSEKHESGTLANALRCVGNVCADNDDGRAKVFAFGFSWATSIINDQILLPLLVQVLYNICREYEPAQQQAVRERIHFSLVRCLTDSPEVFEDVLSTLVELLLWLSAQQANVESEDLSEGKDGAEVMALPALFPDTDADDFASLVEICLVYLRDVKVQEQIVQSKQIQRVWAILENVEERVVRLNGTVSPSSSDVQFEGTEKAQVEEDVKLLVPLSASLTWCLSDIAALLSFGECYGLHDRLFGRLIDILRTQDEAAMSQDGTALQLEQNNHDSSQKLRPVQDLITPPNIAAISVIKSKTSFSTSTSTASSSRLQAAACQVLGNYLWQSPDSAPSLVEESHLHASLFRRITTNTDSNYLFSAASLLVHLGRPSQVIREIMGNDANASTALERLCRYEEMPEVQQAGQKLLRVLVGGSRINLERFKEIVAIVAVASQQESASAGTA